jgi:hypothetical protein
MRLGKSNISLPMTTKMYVIVCLLTSVIFTLTVSFHDYLPVHPPSYLLLAEDKLKHQYMVGSTSKAKGNPMPQLFVGMYATCASAQAPSYDYSSSMYIIVAGNNQQYGGFLSLSADLSPPSS